MPSRRNTIASKKNTKQEQYFAIPLRRTPRLQSKTYITINPKSPSLSRSTPKSTFTNNKTHYKFNKSTPLLTKSTNLSCNFDAISSLRRSPRFSCKDKMEKFVSEKVIDNLGQKVTKKNELKLGFDEVSAVRRSPRISKTKMLCDKDKNKCGKKVVKKNEDKVGVDEVSCVRRSSRLSCKGKPKGLDVKAKKGNKSRRTNVESASVEMKVEKKEIGVKRKREVKVKDRVSVLNGWTKDEEVALQRAYFAVKPTPHFWNKVAKLVPGKSANDCFNKVHSDQSTPRQTQPQRRVNKLKSSPLGKLSLSASKLLKPIGRNARKPTYSKKKSHVAQRTVRHLLRNHYISDQDHEADLFSVLEPKIQASTQKLTHSLLFSTPRNDVGKSRFSQMCCETPSSSRKKSRSRFSNLCPIPLASPPVLKQVKNKAMHEKYIDHLHDREAKRKAVSSWNSKSVPRMESLPDNYHKMDKIKANLVSNTKDAIDQLTQLCANDSVKSSELDDDGVGITDSDDALEDGSLH